MPASVSVTVSVPAFSTTPASKIWIRPSDQVVVPLRRSVWPPAGESIWMLPSIVVVEPALKRVLPLFSNDPLVRREAPSPTVRVPMPRRVPPVASSARVVPVSLNTSTPPLPRSVMPAA